MKVDGLLLVIGCFILAGGFIFGRLAGGTGGDLLTIALIIIGICFIVIAKRGTSRG